MSEEILNKIKFLCKNIAKVEWSGPLFYSIEGDISKPETFKITLQDILPLDMGTSGYTEYNLDDRFIDYLMEKEERMDWNVGHIHSHNTMQVFFSGTDMAELNDNCDGHNFYLSLIVNNYMDFMAKIAFCAKAEHDIKSVPYHALDNNGKPYVIETKDFIIKKEKMFTYDCVITSPAEEILVNDDFGARVAEIMKPKPTPAPVVPVKPVTQYPGGNGQWINGKFIPKKEALAPLKPLPSKMNPVGQTKHTNRKDKSKLSPRATRMKDIVQDISFEDFEDISDIDLVDSLETFTVELFKFTSASKVGETLDDALSDLVDLDLDAYTIATSVVENYTQLYDKHFPDATDEEFSIDTELVVDMLNEQVTIYPIINVAIEAIKAMIAEFEKNGTTV